MLAVPFGGHAQSCPTSPGRGLKLLELDEILRLRALTCLRGKLARSTAVNRDNIPALR